MNTLPVNQRQRGFTLVELMVAMVLGLILIAGVIQVFAANQQTYRVTENLSRLQESGRFAMEFITREVRVIDYKECLNATFSIPTALAGTNNTGLNTSDTITVQKSVSPCAAPVANTLISTLAYSIQVGTAGQPALFDSSGELVEGIENLQIIYGEDTDGDGSPNYYVPASAAGLNMGQVVSIRISLVGVTLEDNVAAQANNVFVFGAAYTPPIVDKKIRRVFTSTIALRNRLP